MQEKIRREGIVRISVVIFILLFAVVVLRTAWLSDDAYITFRTVDNFVRGYGLTWNVAERVQAYTHPLWMLLLSAVYFVTHEIYFSSILLSSVLSLTAVVLFAFRIVGSPAAALLGVTILTLSKSFVDYSTSGLENPLTHLILALFLWIYFRRDITATKTLFLLSLVAAMGVLNRMDTILLFLPALAYAFVRLRKLKGLYAIAIGFLPVVMWEAFSLLYYGFLFPNTAYAKLNTGIDSGMLALQGLYYLENSLRWDPLTFLVIMVGSIVPFVTRKWLDLPISVGIVMYLVYVVKIGGDFMSGRFLSAPLLGAVVLISRYHLPYPRVTQPLLFSAAVFLGLSSPYTPLFSDAGYGFERAAVSDKTRDAHDIADERAFYYHITGLLRVIQNFEGANPPRSGSGQKERDGGSSVRVVGSIGMVGFSAGPSVYIVDYLALADPLLARLPPVATQNWRVGHFGRIIPAGYLDTLASGQNRILDKNLAVYYDKLSVITRGELMDFNRLVEIWNMNAGKYDGLIDFTYYRSPFLSTSTLYVNLEDISRVKAERTYWGEGIAVPGGGIQVNLGVQYHATRIEMSLDNDDSYQILYFDGERELGRQTVPARPLKGGGLSYRVVNVLPYAAQNGYNTIRILALKGDGLYSVGHIRLLE